MIKYSFTDRLCPKCGGAMEHIQIKNDEQDDHGDNCLSCGYKEVKEIPFKKFMRCRDDS